MMMNAVFLSASDVSVTITCSIVGTSRLPKLVVRAGGVLVVRAAQDGQHLVRPLELLNKLPLPVWEQVCETIPKLLMTPRQDEGGSTVVVLMEFDATALVLDGVVQLLLTVRLPEHGVHDIEYPMPLKNVKGRLVNNLDIGNIILVKILYSQHILLLQLQEHLRILLRRPCTADMARLQGAAGRSVKNANAASPATEATPNVYEEPTPRALACEAPILQLLLPDCGALQQIFILEVGDCQFVVRVQSNTRTEHKSIIITVRPAARRIARMRTHRYAVVEDQAVLFVVSERVVPPRGN
mmetsp:Transcript_4518/g.8242  ORF Transcript_4518/g.8242 Transcript_4518/m.8242 type:complete len:297 (-) Transcript_4518:829-1719(-)